ncbi:MAG: hypothetical protein JO112_21365 [Planctomycetes bacterium]|nr:hypothetical protein [Planctomycetota bacterium]
MPARHHILAILLFWGASSSWLLYHDLWPLYLPGRLPPFTTGLAASLEVAVASWLLPGEAPPFAIDLVDEAQSQRTNNHIYWTIYKDDNKDLDMGYVQTWVQYHENDDTFDVISLYKYWENGRRPKDTNAKGRDPNLIIESHYRVTRQGELRGIEALGKITQDLPLTSQKIEVSGKVRGNVVNERFLSHAKIETTLSPTTLSSKPFELDLEPVAMPSRGSVLNPMHPLNRIKGLRPGQHWRMPLIDPLTDALRGTAAKLNLPAGMLSQDQNLHSLEAEVLPQPQTLTWGGQEISCLVIEYHGPDIVARTLVREGDGLVFQQEVTQNGTSLTLERLDPRQPVPDSIRPPLTPGQR